MEKHSATTEEKEAPDAGADDTNSPRIRQIDATVRGLHEATIIGLDKHASESRREDAGASAVAHIVNLFGFAVLALTEIAEAQQRIAEIVTLDFENNREEPVNPTNKIVRNPIGKVRRSPLTPPE